MNVIGIDVGGSTTKIVCVSNGKMLAPMQVKATDPLTSVYGAFGKYLSEEGLTLEDIDKIKVTGVGSTYIREGLYGIPTDKVNEFTSIGLGGLAMSGLDHAIIVSMGTGTAFVEAGNGVNRHMGGTGVGVWQGWVSTGYSATWFDWLGLLLICIVLPAVLTVSIDLAMRKLGWVKNGDQKLVIAK